MMDSSRRRLVDGGLGAPLGGLCGAGVLEPVQRWGVYVLKAKRAQDWVILRRRLS